MAAVGVSGAEQAAPSAIPDTAFHPVSLLPGTSSAEPAGPGATSYLPTVSDPWLTSSTGEGAQPRQPEAGAETGQEVLPTVSPKPTAAPRAQTSSAGSVSTKHRISGVASYYCRAGSSPCTSGYPDGSGFTAYAAAGPRLRAALGPNWRGKVILVDGFAVKLIDWCQCYEGQSNEKLLDLYYDVFARTGSSVTIRW